MHKHFKKRLAAGLAVLSGVAGLVPVNAGDVTYDFTADPSSILTIAGNNTQPWLASGGNPGGFLALTYPVNSLYTAIVFPNIDPGKIVTGFTLTADLRVGNGSNNGGRPADGFSISFARDGDAILGDPATDAGFAGNCCAETGTKTGIAISFDTWSGNTFPTDVGGDTADIEGLIVRVDNKTVGKFPLLNRNGACDAIDSLQTGNWDSQYWIDNADDPATAALVPGAWKTLCWQPVSVQMSTDAKLTVKWKGNTILNGFQTTYFPSAGQLVLASRTGGANENTHFDNIHLVTESATVTAVPDAPPNLTATAGARRVGLAWDAAVVPGNPNAQVAYEIERDGVVLVALSTARTYEDRAVVPGKSYTYKVRGKNIAGLVGADSTVAATTGTETNDLLGFMRAEQWLNQTGASTADLDAAIAATQGVVADKVRYVNGFSFGEPNFGDTWGENHLVKISGVFTAPTGGAFRFYIRSDDASYLFVNQAGAAIPDGVSSLPDAIESGCCGGFKPVAADGTAPEVTSAPINLTAGSKYGIAYFVKEGGGGDWGQVSIKAESDPTPVTSLTPLRGGVLSGPADTTGAIIAIVTQPGATTVNANEPVTLTASAAGSSPYGADYANAIVYQWYDNGTPILGANGPTLSWANIPAALNGHTFAVGAGVAGKAVLGAPFPLTVNADTIPPVVTRVAGSPTFDSVTFYFSEPVTDTALTVGNYTVTGLTLSAPVRVNNTTVKFTSSKQAENTVYPVTVNGVKDLGNNSSAFTGTFTSFQFKTGLVTYKTYQGETGGFDTFVTGDPPVKDKPATTDEIRTSFQANTGDVYDNYFGQLTAFFVPPTTGDYVFFMSSDDHGELYLSTDADPANKKKIAEEPSWGGRNNWVGDDTNNNNATRGLIADGQRTNRSDQYATTEWAGGNTIHLTGGSRYYLEVLFKEGGGGDNGGATYIAAGGALPADGSASTLSGNVVGTYVDPGLLPPILITGPTTVKYAPGGKVEFKVVADSAVPMTYQWYHNKKAVAGATSDTLTINNAGIADIGDYRVRVTNANGSLTTGDNDSRALMTGAFVVEVEDFNFDNGQTLAAANTMPLASDIFKGKDGQPDVDLHVAESTADGGANGNSLRQGWNDNGTVNNAPEGANSDVISDDGGGGPGGQNRERPDFTLTSNYKIGWGDPNEWYNYTRNFPAGTYNAAIGFSQDGTGVDTTKFALELVSGDITKPDQTTVVVAEATADQTGGWSSVDLIPFVAPGGSTPAAFTLGANTTVRLRIVASGPDLDYLLFYKVGAPPVVTVDPVPPAIPGIDANGLTNVNHNAATKTVTATTNGNSGMLKISGATRIVSVTLVGTTLTVVYE